MPAKSARGKKSSWKNTQSKTRIKKRTKLALIVLGLIILIFIIGQGINFTKSIFSPLNINSQKGYLWDNKFNLNLLIKDEHLSVLTYNPQDEKITIIKIPDQTLIEVPSGLGSWQARSIQGVGGEEVLKDSIASFLGIPLDGFIDSKTDLISEARKDKLGILKKISSIKTDLTFLELLRLQFSLSSVRFDKIKTVDLLEAQVLDKKRLADGTEVFSADPFKLDSVLSDFVDPKIISEHLTIGVFNATSYPQLAQKGARMITNLGGNVIILSNATPFLDKTYVVGGNSKTFERLTQIFGIGCESFASGKCDKIKSGDATAQSRAQINIYLGEDFYQRFGNQ